MVKQLALYFGIVLAAVGVLGFVPGVTNEQGLLLGIFQVDAIHNIIHLATGLVGILVALMWSSHASLYFKVFGVVYGLVTVVGFIQGDSVLNLIAVNMADNVLHVAITAFALWAGFMLKSDSSMSSGMSAEATM